MEKGISERNPWTHKAPWKVRERSPILSLPLGPALLRELNNWGKNGSGVRFQKAFYATLRR